MNIFQEEQVILAKVKAENSTLSKRPYLADYQSFASLFSPKNVAFNISKAGILSFSLFLLEFNQHIDKKIAAQQRGEDVGDDIIGDYDWKSAKEKYMPIFLNFSSRFVGTSIIRKCYELVAVTSVELRIADRLCKDAAKSFVRKCAKFTRSQALARILKTSLWSSVLLYASSFTYDLLHNIFDFGVKGRKVDLSTIGNSVVWVVKKGSYYCILLCFYAVGFSIGSYVSGDIGSLIGSALLEGVGNSIASSFLGLPS